MALEEKLFITSPISDAIFYIEGLIKELFLCVCVCIWFYHASSKGKGY